MLQKEKMFPSPACRVEGRDAGPRLLTHGVHYLPPPAPRPLGIRRNSLSPAWELFPADAGGLSGEGVPLPPSTQEMTSGFLTLGNPGSFRPSWFPS